MGFDRFYAPITAIGDYFDSPKDIRRLIHKEFFYKSKKELIIFISPGKKEPFAFALKRRVLKRDKSYLEYYFPERLVSKDYKLTKKIFKIVKKKIRADIHKLRKRFTKITLIGMSVGCANTLMIADNNQDIDKLILVIPGNCLAEGIWKSVRTKRLKKEIEKKITLKELKKYWKDISPENNVSNIKAKEVYFYLSKADESIPYENGLILFNLLNKHGHNPILRENKHLGHYLTAVSFFMFSKDI